MRALLGGIEAAMFVTSSLGGIPIGVAPAVTRSLLVPDLLGTGQSLFWIAFSSYWIFVSATQESLFFLVATPLFLYYVH